MKEITKEKVKEYIEARGLVSKDLAEALVCKSVLEDFVNFVEGSEQSLSPYDCLIKYGIHLKEKASSEGNRGELNRHNIILSVEVAREFLKWQGESR
jgi:hypothetical protein